MQAIIDLWNGNIAPCEHCGSHDPAINHLLGPMVIELCGWQCIENYFQIVNITSIELFVFLICAKIILKKGYCKAERYFDHGKKIHQRK